MRLRIPDEWFGLFLPSLNGYPHFANVPHRTPHTNRHEWNPRLVRERARRLADWNTARGLLSDWP